MKKLPKAFAALIMIFLQIEGMGLTTTKAEFAVIESRKPHNFGNKTILPEM